MTRCTPYRKVNSLSTQSNLRETEAGAGKQILAKPRVTRECVRGLGLKFMDPKQAWASINNMSPTLMSIEENFTRTHYLSLTTTLIFLTKIRSYFIFQKFLFFLHFCFLIFLKNNFFCIPRGDTSNNLSDFVISLKLLG